MQKYHNYVHSYYKSGKKSCQPYAKTLLLILTKKPQTVAIKRDTGIEPASYPWEGHIIAFILIPPKYIFKETRHFVPK